jgi:hypothetical protein
MARIEIIYDKFNIKPVANIVKTQAGHTLGDCIAGFEYIKKEN